MRFESGRGLLYFDIFPEARKTWVADDFFIVRFKLAYSNSAKRRSEQTSVYFAPHLALFIKLQEAYPEYKKVSQSSDQGVLF